MGRRKKLVSTNGYYYRYMPEHPFCNNKGYVFEHRLVYEKNIGRFLRSEEEIHHINRNRKDNRIENLSLKSKGEHKTFHNRERGILFVDFKCVECGVIFSRKRKQTHLVKKGREFSACSSKCAAIFRQKIKRFGRTTEVERAISENVVRVYRKYSHDNSEQTLNKGMRRGHTPAACDGEEMVQPASLL